MSEKPKPVLTNRERQCLTWLAVGLRSQEMAEEMGISVKTVEKHIASGRKRLNATTREHAVAKAIQMGLITP